MPPCNETDTDSMSGAKASPLLFGLPSRENMINRHKDAKQMTTEQSVGAASYISVHWREIDWRSVNESVRRLQVRIVKAVETGKWGKVKALQRLLTSSRNGKLLAVRRVTENAGRNTSGVDGVSWNTPEKKMAAVDGMKRRGYRPLPLRRIYIPKSNGKLRPLGIPTMKDRAMQALHLLALDPVAETTADVNSYGFRKKRSCADAIEGCFTALARHPGWVLEGDIRGCFDNISHEWLMTHVPMDRVILRKWLKSGYLEKKSFYRTEQGTPQGGIISPVLANFALDGLERCLREKYPLRGPGSWHGILARVHLIRYADDFIITGKSKEMLDGEVKPLVESFLRERGLELSTAKTVITHVEQGFDFLGQNVRRYRNGKLLIKPSKKNIHTFLEKVREVVKKAQAYPTWQLIANLNRMLRGWAMYHRHVVSKRIFSQVDYAIFKSLWQWALTRHPRKGKRWVMRRYFAQRGGRAWCFFGERKYDNGSRELVWLYHATSLPIRRHVKIKREANPYHPSWEMYFEARESRHMTQTLVGCGRLLSLWRTQGGKCIRCGETITRETGWHSHHIIPKVLGGSDGVMNRQLLHPGCHRQLHSNLAASASAPLTRRSGRLEPCEVETLTHGS
jgi:RNA-directed DNA polymerase